MTMKLRKIYIPLVAAVLCSCEKELDFKYDSVEPIYVIITNKARNSKG